MVIVGAGLSGLIAARRLQLQGLRVRVLEARARVGGRMVSHTLADGSVVDLGGQWGGSSHHRFSALLEELGISRYRSHYEGEGVFCWRGQHVQAPLADRFEESLLFFEPAALGLEAEELAATQALQQAFAALVAQINPYQPWLSPDAERLDRLSVAAWAAEHTPIPLARLPLDWLCRVGGSGGFEPWEASILHLAWTQAVAPQAETPEAWLVRGGAGAVAQQLAAELEALSPGSLQLAAPVLAIEQHREAVAVRVDGAGPLQARGVIVAVPPPQRQAIQFDPPLPPAHQALLQRTAMGGMTKILVRYSRPFWREQGLNGLGIGDRPWLELTADSGPPEGQPAVLASFVAGERALRLAALPAAERRVLILRDLVAYWGPEAGSPLELVEQPWNSEAWTGGAFTSFPAPGSWTSHACLAAADNEDEDSGPAPARHGRIWWAGSEASPRWPGYFEGAIEAGERAATVVAKALATTATPIP